MNYKRALEVENIALDLIGQYHFRLDELPIRYLFAQDPIKKAGRERAGEARIVKGLNAYLAGDYRQDEADMAAEPYKFPAVRDFFVITISYPSWERFEKLPAQQCAKMKLVVVDHELTHCDLDEDRNLILVPHDVEDFVSIVERYGLYSSDLERMFEASAQPGLFDRQAVALDLRRRGAWLIDQAHKVTMEDLDTRIEATLDPHQQEAQWHA